MIERGKFRSLTLVIWNGFFARTFDLYALVTTLSGGNGAEKSTTMAAVITDLIPDFPLLHFRNTTEAGAISGSRDKGLHRKLLAQGVLFGAESRQLPPPTRAGVRSPAADSRARSQSGHQTVYDPWAAVQSAPTAILTMTLCDRQARALPQQELKERVEETETVLFKQFNFITDYHSLIFDLAFCRVG